MTNDNTIPFPRKKKPMPNPYAKSDVLAAESATATAVHIHVFGKYLLTTGRAELAGDMLRYAKAVHDVAEILKKGSHLT